MNNEKGGNPSLVLSRANAADNMMYGATILKIYSAREYEGMLSSRRGLVLRDSHIPGEQPL